MKELENEVLNFDEVSAEIKVTCVECASILEKASELCRTKAVELLIYMICDTDRMKTEDASVYTHPVAYALKGNSLSAEKMYRMINTLRNKLKEHNIPVLCESSDGQWAPLVFYSEDKFPLTLLHLQKLSWSSVTALSKCGAIAKLLNISSVPLDDLKFIEHTSYQLNSCSMIGNVSVFMNHTNNLKNISISCNGGQVQYCGLLRYVNLKDIDVSAQEVLKCRTDKPKKVIGMTESEMNLLSTLPFEYISEVVNPAEEYNSDIQLENVLLDECIKILDDICVALQNVNKNKWQDATRTSIFPSLLANKDKLLSECRHTELNCIADVIKSYTECIMFVRTDNKVKKNQCYCSVVWIKQFFCLA